MKIIAITSEKGGVGKTSTSANVAAALAARGDTVLVIDMDPQGNLTTLYGAERSADTIGTAQLLSPASPASLAEAIRPGVAERIDLLPAVRAPLKATARELTGAVGREFFLRDALAGAENVYDWVICDTKPDTEVLTVNAICAADGVVAIAEYDNWAAEGAATIAGLVKQCSRLPGVDARFLGLAFNKVEAGRIVTRFVGADVAKTNLEVFNACITFKATVKQANYAGVAARDFDPDSDSAAEFDAVAKEIDDRLAGREPAPWPPNERTTEQTHERTNERTVIDLTAEEGALR